MPLKPEDVKKLTESAQKLRYLIADPSSSRKSLRKMLGDFQVRPSNIDVVEKFTEATDMIKAKKPNVIFADYSLDGEGALALVEHQRAALEGKELGVFFLSTQKDSNAVMSGAAEESVDGLLLKPFTFEALKDVFMENIQRKIAPTPYEKTIESGQALLHAKKTNEALELFRKAIGLSPKPALACYWEGQTFEQLEKVDEAIRSYEKGLSHDPTHYRCLLGLVQSRMKICDYNNAYNTARKLSESHTVPVKHVPLLIRASIYNLKFEEILAFYSYVDAMLQIDPRAAESLSAGLVVAGTWMLRRGKKEEAVNAFRKAEVSSRGNPKILKKIAVELMAKGMDAEKKALMTRLPQELKDSPEFINAEIEYLMSQPETVGQGLQMANDMISSGKADPFVYEVTIKKMIESGRKKDRAQELVDEACAKFPNEQTRFKNLIPQA